MRILHLHFGREGGAERFFVSLAQGFAERGVEQRFIIRPDRSWGDDVKALGPVIENRFSNVIRATGYLQARRWWIERTWQPDAIMAWMPRAAKLLPRNGPAIKVTRLGDFPKHLRHFRNCDVMVGNLPGIGDRLRSLGWTREIRIISNFPRPVVPTPVARSTYDTPDDAFLVTAGGRLQPRKGFDTALRTIARMPGAWLWLMGEGPEEPALRALAQELGVADRVRFTGWLDEPINAIAAGDAFLMPSRHEPLGNMLLDAWTAGVPSVSTRSEGPTWFMRDGVDGILTEIDDDAALAKGLEALRADPALGQRFVASAHDRVNEMFSRDAVIDAYLNLFRETGIPRA